MKKFIAFFSIVALITFGLSNYTYAQDDSTTIDQPVEDVQEQAIEQTQANEATMDEAPKSFHMVL